ncbi:membrane or secreted protein [mine drainage metagenome]|uniref:Membrane or secreted protein n=1 Tax=mine drainage metagenome TaxID=410659 RepID=T1C0L1_9ZZZZ
MPRTPRLSPLALALVLALAPALPLLAAPASAAKPALNPAKEPFAHLAFRNLGPAVAGGRVTAIAGIPGNPRVFYVGAASGGVWKTVDGGLHFTSIFGKEAPRRSARWHWRRPTRTSSGWAPAKPIFAAM